MALNLNKKQTAFAKKSNFNMLSFGKTWLTQDGDKVKFRILLKKDGGRDDEGNEYTREEMAQLLAEALLSGAAINCHLFDSAEGMEGNARINIKELEAASAPAPASQRAKVNPPKRQYEVVAAPVEEYDEPLPY